MGSRIHRTVTNIALMVGSLVACALLLEGSVRVYADLLFPKMMVLDDRLGWRHATNVKKVFNNEFGERNLVLLDEFGNRGTGHAKNKKVGKYRILALGDSFTEGVQVSETDVFTAQIERADSGLEVINTGVGGYGTVQEYLYLTEDGVKFDPDLVLLMFFENDLTDNILTYYPGFGPKPYARVRSGSINIVRTLDASAFRRFVLPAPFQITLNKYSYFYDFANSRIYQPMFAGKLKAAQQADLQQIDTDQRYHVFFGVLDKLKQFAQEQNIPLFVAVIPTREEVASRHSDVAARITSYCNQENISCLSLLHAFVEHSSDRDPLYFREDMHWTRQGHTVAAQEILAHLRSAEDTLLRRGERSNPKQ